MQVPESFTGQFLKTHACMTLRPHENDGRNRKFDNQALGIVSLRLLLSLSETVATDAFGNLVRRGTKAILIRKDSAG